MAGCVCVWVGVALKQHLVCFALPELSFMLAGTLEEKLEMMFRVFDTNGAVSSA